MNIGILGNGKMAKILAEILYELKHTIQIGVRNLDGEFEKKPFAEYVHMSDIAIDNELVIIAIPSSELEDALKNIKNPEARTFLDLTNPVDREFNYTNERGISNGEFVQLILKDSNVVKALNIYGVEVIARPHLTGKKLTMLMAGSNHISNKKVENLIFDMGFDPLVVGDIHYSKYLESIGMMWIDMVRKEKRDIETGLIWVR